ncbi:glycoside hydrolase family protein [Methylobacterium sp. CM6247]
MAGRRAAGSLARRRRGVDERLRPHQGRQARTGHHQAHADAFFLGDLASHALPILSAIKVPVAEHEREALISIAFNIGVGGFTGSTFLHRLSAGERKGYAEAIELRTKNKELPPDCRAGPAPDALHQGGAEGP